MRQTLLPRLVRLACIAVVILVLWFKLLQLFVFLPLAGPIISIDAAYLLFMILSGVAIVVLGVRKHSARAAMLAAILLVFALAYWWFFICRATHPIWSDFGWFVIPDACFAIAIVVWGVATRTISEE